MQSLVGLNFNQEAVEADLRYGLVRVRENAESIAFYGGQSNEMAALMQVGSNKQGAHHPCGMVCVNDMPWCGVYVDGTWSLGVGGRAAGDLQPDEWKLITVNEITCLPADEPCSSSLRMLMKSSGLKR